jgi:hypothetical protein
MDKRDNTAVLAQVQAFAQQNSGRSIEGRIIGPRGCEVIEPISGQIPCSSDGFLGPFEISRDFFAVLRRYTSTPSRLAFR